jgi:UPF0042 nucleotide-binding protein
VSRALEDIGWLCVDNLPTALIPRFADLMLSSDPPRPAAVVVDVRERDFIHAFPSVHRALRESGPGVSLLFLEAAEPVLVRRFSETRRPHPLAPDEPALQGIREERAALSGIRQLADHILDTSDYTVHELREYIRERFDLRPGDRGLVVSVTSFGYKYGVLAEADLVLDVRFLPNPNFVPRLQPLTGNDPPVLAYLRRQADTRAFLDRVRPLLRFLLPRYLREGKTYLTIGVGCTGGRHRSVALATMVGRLVGDLGFPGRVRHRDLHQGIPEPPGPGTRTTPPSPAARGRRGGSKGPGPKGAP